MDYTTAHLLEDRPVEFFETNLSDFPEIAAVSHYKRNRSPIEYTESMVRKMHRFAHIHLTHFGVARAMAYSLTVYASKMMWTPDRSGNFTKVPLDYFMIETLPYSFLEKLYSRFE